MTDKETVDRAVRAYCSRHGIDAFVPKAALIDMDGTLIDSMRNHAGAWYRLSRELGLEAAEEEFYLFEGMTGRATVRLLFSRCKGYEPSDTEGDELYERKARYFNELPRVPVIPGAARMLSVLTEAGVTRVLVTGSKQRANLDRLDTDFPGAFPHNLRVTAADVTHGKPHPEPYLKAMAMASVESAMRSRVTSEYFMPTWPMAMPSHTAMASGAFTVAVATGPIPEETLRAAGADLVFGSMDALLLIMNNTLQQ